MRFWRICRSQYAADAASGEGARLFGSRWNSRGLRVVYASTSLALAAVETFVNLDPNTQPGDLVSIEGEVSGELKVERLEPAALPWYRRRDESASLRWPVDSRREDACLARALRRNTGGLEPAPEARVKMVRHLTSSLVDVMYILDEPSVGLHPGTCTG